MWEGQNLTPAVISKLELFSLMPCCWILYFRAEMVSDKELSGTTYKLLAGGFWWPGATKGKSATCGDQAPASDWSGFLAPGSYAIPCPEQWGGKRHHQPRQHHSSICWSHTCPGNLLCPSASLVSRQLERTDKSCTHFNGPKGPCFPFLLCSRPARPTLAPEAQRNILSLWKTEIKSSHREKICPNNQSWVSCVIIKPKN